MRENEKILNQEDDKKNIDVPVRCAVIGVCLLIGLLIWFGVKDPELFGKIRDFCITLIVFLLFLINTAAAILFFFLTPLFFWPPAFFLSSRIGSARTALDQALTNADGKVEELADKTIIILKKILEPFIKVKAEKAGILTIFSKRKAE